jgi:hypothetical protein
MGGIEVIALHQERRHCPRLVVAVEAEHRFGAERIRLRVGDLSTGGLLLHAVFLPPGMRLELVLRSPRHVVEVTVQAEVVRRSATDAGLLTGLRFVDLDPRARAQLELLLIELLLESDLRGAARRFVVHRERCSPRKRP